MSKHCSSTKDIVDGSEDIVHITIVVSYGASKRAIVVKQGMAALGSRGEGGVDVAVKELRSWQ